MTQDPYRLNDDLRLTADDASVSATSGDDEYDGLDLVDESGDKPGRRKLPILLGLLAVTAIGGFLAYEVMMPGESDLPVTHKIIEMAPEQAATTPAVAGDLPPVVAVAEPSLDPLAPLEPIPAQPEESAIAPLPVDPAAPGLETADATLAAVPAPDVSAAAVEGVDPVIAPIDVTSVDAPTPAPQPELQEPVPETVTEAAPVASPAALPAPPQELLSPIDQNAVIDSAASIPIPPGATPTQKSAANTIAAVNDILGGDAAGMPAPTAQAMAQQVEVTPRAAQVIVVTKNYAAQSSQAVVAAGDRVLQARQYAAAVDIFNRELNNNPSDPLALAGKALAQQKSGQIQAAMDTYERLIDLNPRDLEALTNYLGLLQTQDPQEALGRLNALSVQYPSNAAVAGQLGMVHAGMMDTPDALRYFQKAASLDATNPTYPFNLAVLYDRLGTTQMAHNEYMRALKLARDYPAQAAGISLETIRKRLSVLEF